MPHIHDLIDLTVSAYIVHPTEDKVLLVDHKKHKKWLQLGGHVELDESSDEALLREIEEECGLEVEILSDKPTVVSPGFTMLYTPFSMNIHWVTETHRHLDLVYVALAKSDQFVLSDEHHNMKWLSESDLAGPQYDIQPVIKYYAHEAIKLAHPSRSDRDR